jgi:hypothetical protein
MLAIESSVRRTTGPAYTGANSMRAVRALVGSAIGFFLLENLVFSFYPRLLNPDSSTGRLELVLGNELRRTVEDHRQILAVGDSRMGFFPRYANELTGETGYTFASITVPGTTPRCWYYMLREIDPAARRYAAIVIPVYDYDDQEIGEDSADRVTDLHYLAPLLRWSDVAEFSRSYDSASLAWEAAFGILLKGTVYQADFQDLLLHPSARIHAVQTARRDSAVWYYDFVGSSDSLKGSTPYAFDPLPPDRGQQGAYLRTWFTRICERYRGSGTRIVFVRLPRGPFVRPDPPPKNPHSSVRDLTARGDAILDQEHFFDALEKPDLFSDPLHLNGPGCARFSRMLALHIPQLLGGAP